jgi:hypothetical protein
MISIVLWLLNYPFSLKFNLPTARKAKKSLKNFFFCWHLESHYQQEKEPDPDPYQNVTDPEH